MNKLNELNQFYSMVTGMPSPLVSHKTQEEIEADWAKIKQNQPGTQSTRERERRLRKMNKESNK